MNIEGQVLFDGTAADVTAIKAEVSSWKQVRRLVSRGFLRNIIIGITSNGNIYVRGSKKINEIQILKQQKQVVDVQATLDSFFTLKTDGTVFSTNKAYNTSGWKDVVEIEADQHDVYALCADGTLLHSGSDYYGFADELNTWKLFSDIDEANQKMESFPAVMKKQEMQKQLDQAQRKFDELSEKKKQTKGMLNFQRFLTTNERRKEGFEHTLGF